MRGVIILVAGVIIATVGMIFHLQGQAVVGPESSFMYSNPDWATYGMQIAVAGIIVIASGVIITAIKRN